MPLSDAVIAVIADTLSGAPRAHRKFTARRLADIYGVSVSTVYRHAKLNGPKRNRGAQRPEYRDWVRIAVKICERAPRRISLDQGIESGVASGALPPEATDMPIATAHRVVQELGLKRRSKRSFRLAAEHPMQAILIDGSTSQHLTVAEDLGGGDFLLKLHRAPYSASGYKNKPLGPDRLRAVVYGIWEMCTGYRRALYLPALGENAVDAAEALCRMLAETGDPARPLHGVPANLWSDKGPLVRGRATADLLERLGIHVPDAPPYHKARMGGIERTWRTLWKRFEGTLFLRGLETIRLSDLNARLEEFERRENLRPSRTPVAGRPASRTDAWIALTNARPAENRLRKLPQDPMRTLVREAHRTVDACGIVRWAGVEYECKAFHGQRVLLRRSLEDADTLLAIDEATKETDTARVWTPRAYGEIRTAPKTELERLVEEDAENPVPAADPYAPRTSEHPNVVSMPVRSAPAAPLEDPMAAADRYASLDEALRDFVRICGLAVWAGLSEASRERVKQRMLELELDRAAVVDLAQRLGAAAYGESA